MLSPGPARRGLQALMPPASHATRAVAQAGPLGFSSTFVSAFGRGPGYLQDITNTCLPSVTSLPSATASGLCPSLQSRGEEDVVAGWREGGRPSSCSPGAAGSQQPQHPLGS